MTVDKRTDVFSREKRSEVMRAVKGRDTGPELKIRKALHARGFRYRLNDKTLPGSPDLVFPRHRAILFVHGCFWHGHDCARGSRLPKTNVKYWREKIARNAKRDAEACAALRRMGWRVKISWECDLQDAGRAARKIAGWLLLSTDEGRTR